ncbi:hypothetical protein FHQ08_07825 [Lactobacillus sp. CC-MHH1034]|uniref:hypothetical protein n=1 Tax=Agrilactobacillus fermenti TaxID=2586909 RepID=UPI001E4C0DDA|nr:hypothetical protein [Agrilactobacillus fermenti]MCD2256627.1 hypothetical protein [Agrilactobacillus fermenti]
MKKHKIFALLLGTAICMVLFFVMPEGLVQANISKKMIDNTTTVRPEDMRINPDTGKQYLPGEGISVKSGVQTDTQTNGIDFVTADQNGRISGGESTVYIQPKANDQAWFSMNYIQSGNGKTPGFIHFNDANAANSFYKNSSSADYNQNQSKSKMVSGPDGKPVLDTSLADGYDNGYLNVTGNVPVFVKIKNDKDHAVSDLFGGNWGVMIRVVLPEDIDRESLANAIDWEQTYFYLSLESNSIIADAAGKFNFPLQFDHRVYFDTDKDNVFYLKVKGVPFREKTGFNWGNVSTFNLLAPEQDLTDYYNNITVKDNKVVRSVEDNGTTKNSGAITPWNPIRILGAPAGAVSQTGPVGTATSLINLATGSHFTAGVANIGGWLVGYFVDKGFNGTANINFNLDMSKYTGNKTTAYKALTQGRLFPSPYSDGRLNTDNGLNGNRRAIGIDLYGTSQLVDPYKVGRDMLSDDNILNKTDVNSDASYDKKWKGNTPMDYAVIKKSELEKGAAFPVYTNFTSWNSFVAPFDNLADRHTVGPDNQAIPDTHDSKAKAAYNIRNRVAKPDPYIDGILVNPFINKQTFGTADKYDYHSTSLDNPFLLNQQDAATGQVTAGAITPQRYAQVYSYYKFDANDPNKAGAVEPTPIHDKTQEHLKLTVTPTVSASYHQGSETYFTGDLDGAGNLKRPVDTQQTWDYEGTYDGVPIAGAKLRLEQQLRPEVNLNLPDPILVSKKALMKGQTYTYHNIGNWNDPFPGPYSGDLSLANRFGAVNAIASGEQSLLNGLNRDKNTINFTINGHDYGDPNGGTETSAGKFSVQDIDEGKTFNVNYDINTQFPTYTNIPILFLQDRYANVAIQSKDLVTGALNHYQIPHEYENGNSENDSVNEKQHGISLFILDDVKNELSITKKFQITDGLTSTQRYIDAKHQIVKVVATAVNKGNAPLSGEVTLFVPNLATNRVNSIVVSDLGGTPKMVQANASSRLNDYTEFSFIPDKPIDVGKSFSYTYTYAITDYDSIPLENILMDHAMQTSGTQATMIGQSNNIFLYKLAGPQILQVPELNFGKHVTTQKGPYQSTEKPRITLYDNDSTDSWTLSANMSPFHEADSTQPFMPDQSAITLDLGHASRIGSDLGMDEVDETLRYNHTADTLTADGTMYPIYVLDQSFETSTANYFDLNFDTPAKLNFPESAFGFIKLKKYQANITYSVTVGP